ncbi:hypothetical protein PaG_03942 [Moesziomyces aphidis]|uniref:F-box domain-containing protein n=1 Tax=Moesziomyces aphidis TaxID=84754 RepID=W3VJL2_MOEAP|nr:hypothetical protein PaG_03942 [Moesziomyces aphidis]
MASTSQSAAPEPSPKAAKTAPRSVAAPKTKTSLSATRAANPSPKASSSDSPLRRAQASGTSTASAAARKMPTAASAPRTDPAPSIQLQQTATADSTNAQASTSTPQSYRDESTSTDDQASLVSRIGFEPRSTSGLPDPSMRTNEAIVWLDIDNTLYKRSTRIAELMAERIRAYFHGMGLSQEEARSLHSTYYKTYGLAIRGLVKHHQIDPLDYDRKCDASLPLEDILRPDAQIKQLLSDLDRTRVRVFALTNAYKYHADRVLRLLDLEDQVEGIVYCDYATPDFACKPELDYYRAALLVVGASPNTRNYFVDDSSLNVVAAKELGWHSCIYFREEDDPLPPPAAVNGADKEAASSFDATALVPRKHTTASDATATSAFDEEAIRREFQKLPSHLRIQLLGIILDACLPGDIATMSKTLEKHLRMTRDVVSGLPDTVALKIFEKLPIQDLLRCRHVSKKWHSLAATPDLWRSHALALTEADPVKVSPPSEPQGWEPLVKNLFFRERNWAKGLAQSIQTLEGHTGFVTAMKLKGRKTLVSGSYDETIRVWDISTGLCRKVLRAKAIACLDFLLDEGVLCAGLYDTGRVLVWDMKSWEVIQTLSGHNRGIRNVAINEQYLVSVGQDKAIVVWDWRTGAKLVRFGQQSNVSLGVSLVDQDKLVAVTVDGMIRCFSIPRREMIGQFQLTKLGGADLGLGARLGDLASGSSMLEWFAAHGNTLTVASKNVVVHLEWREHVVPARSTQAPLTAESLRQSASSRLSNAGSTAGPGLSPLRTRRDSSMSNASSAAVSPLASAAARSRRDSNTSVTSSASGMDAARSPRRSINGSAANRPSVRTPRSSLAPSSTNDSPASQGLSTPSRPRPSPTTRRVGGPAPWPLATATTESAGRTSGTSTPGRMSKSVSEVSLNFPTTPTKDAPEADAESDGIANGAASGDASPAEGSGGSATRIAPNLSLPPKVVSVLETPDVAVGCVDPTKRRIVASTRFSSRAGAERRIYASSLPFDHGKTATQLEAKAGADMSVNQDGEALKTASTSNEPQSSSDGDSPSTHAAGLVAPIRGAWEAQAGALATPARNPMAMELDHESVVVGCADGLIYRIHFVGSEYGPETLLDAAASSDGASGSGAGGAPGVGDATITDLLQLRDVWKEIMVPAGEPDHPGRLRVDRLKAMGLK